MKRVRSILAVHEDIDAADPCNGPWPCRFGVRAATSDRQLPRVIVLAVRSADIAEAGPFLPGVDAHLIERLDEEKLLGRSRRDDRFPGYDHPVPEPLALRIEGGRMNRPGRTFVHADGREVVLTRRSCAAVAFVTCRLRVVARSVSQARAGHGEVVRAASICDVGRATKDRA